MAQNVMATLNGGTQTAEVGLTRVETCVISSCTPQLTTRRVYQPPRTVVQQREQFIDSLQRVHYCGIRTRKKSLR